MVRNIYAGFQAFGQQFFHHCALQGPHYIAGTDAAGGANALAQLGHVHKRIAIVGTVIQAIGARFKQAFSAGVFAGEFFRIFHRCDGHRQAAHLCGFQGEVYREIVVARHRANHYNIPGKHVGAPQHKICKARHAVIAYHAAGRRRTVTDGVIDFAGNFDGLQGHHAACAAHALKHQHVAGVHNMPGIALSKPVGNFLCHFYDGVPLCLFYLFQHAFHGRKIFIHQHGIFTLFLSFSNCQAQPCL